MEQKQKQQEQQQPQDSTEEDNMETCTCTFKYTTKFLTAYSTSLNYFRIFFLLVAWISIAAVPKPQYLNMPRSPTENAFLFFGIIGFFIEVGIILLYLFNIPKRNEYKILPFDKIFFIKDIIFAISMLSVTIAACVKMRENNESIREMQNRLSYPIAVATGFLATITYLIPLVKKILKIIFA